MPITTIKELRFHTGRSTLSQPIADSTHTISAVVVDNGMALPREGAGWGFRFKASALSAL
jgi:hypothetical protein